MARIEFARGVTADIDRILAHLTHFEVKDAGAHIAEIIQAINVLEHSPWIGRPVADSKRELIIGKGARGYVALSCYIEELDVIFVLALRSQREAGV